MLELLLQKSSNHQQLMCQNDGLKQIGIRCSRLDKFLFDQLAEKTLRTPVTIGEQIRFPIHYV